MQHRENTYMHSIEPRATSCISEHLCVIAEDGGNAPKCSFFPIPVKNSNEVVVTAKASTKCEATVCPCHYRLKHVQPTVEVQDGQHKSLSTHAKTQEPSYLFSRNLENESSDLARAGELLRASECSNAVRRLVRCGSDITCPAPSVVFAWTKIKVCTTSLA